MSETEKIESLSQVSITDNQNNVGENSDDNDDMSLLEEPMNHSDDEQKEDIITLDIESVGTESDEDDKEIEFNVDCINAQMNFRSQRRQKLRKQARATLVDKFGTLADFRTYLKVNTDEYYRSNCSKRQSKF